MDNLEQAIRLAQEAAAVIPSNHPSRSSVLYSLGTVFRNRFLRRGALNDLEEAIKQYKEAIKQHKKQVGLNTDQITVSPPKYIDEATLLHASSHLLLLRYQRLGELDNLEQAVEQSQAALVLTPLDSPDRDIRLQHLGVLTRVRTELSGVDLTTLEQMISIFEEMVVTFAPNDPSLPITMTHLGTLLHIRYDRLEVLADIDRAINLVQNGLASTTADSTDRATMMYNLGLHYDAKFERLGEVNDLKEGMKWGERGIAIAATDHPLLQLMLTDFGDMLRSHYEKFGDPEDLAQGMKHSEEAIVATNSNDGPSCFSLGKWLRCKFQRFGSLADLEHAIKWHEQAIILTTSNLEMRVTMLHDLGTLLHVRFRRLGDIRDLEKGIQLGDEMIAVTPSDHSRWAWMSHCMSVLLCERFLRLGDLVDINRGIKCGEQAVKATPSDDPDRWYRVSSLAELFARRFEKSQDMQDLELAIKWSGKAIAETPPGHPDRAIMLSTFGVAMCARFRKLGATDGFELAIRSLEEAVASMPEDHPKRVHFLHNLGGMLYGSFGRLGYVGVEEQGLKWTEESVRATPPDHYLRPSMLRSFGGILLNRFDRLRNVDDLEQAIKLGMESETGTPPGHAQRVGVLCFLGTLFRTRYEFLGDPDDLKNAIRWGELSKAISSPNDPNRAQHLTELGISMAAQLEKPGAYTGTAADTCFRIFLDAWNCQTSTPRQRISAAINGVRVLATACRWQEAGVLVEDAVKILAKVSPRILGRSDQEFELSGFGRLPSDAVSVSLQGGASASHCLRLLELGRGIITGHVIDCRSDLSELQESHPDKFTRFNLLRTEIDSPFVASDVSDQYTETDMPGRARRVQAVRELDRMLVDIRRLPGFDGFLLPPTAEDLMAIAAEGPIVIVNHNEARSDAIIVTTSGIQALQLPNMHYSDVQKYMQQMTKELVVGNRSTYPSRNKRMAHLLRWLWDVAVEPVLDELEFGPVFDDSNLPRIWWIGVGPLGMAPFHAAGDHSSGSTRNTISRAISSYVSTIKALSYARQKKFELLNSPEAGLLLVTMATTPGCGSLVNAIQEARDIAHIAPGRATLWLDRPSTAEVLQHLPAYHAIHFACHGVSHGQHPSKSHLLLCKVDANSGLAEIDQLTVGAISSVNLKHAQLAFLGACQTADNAVTALANESIHIASGFQLAGFSHVLATLWQSRDDACRQVAIEFYRFLFNSQGGDREHHRAVSTAFHHSVRKLRVNNLTQPLLWASFIHTGA